MLKSLKYVAISLLAIFILSGCTGTPVYNVDNSNVIDGTHKLKRVEMAIKKGAKRKGWRVKKVKTGLLTAKNNVRGKHLVVVNIVYDTKGYKISYKDSKNLKYDPEAKTIHKSYNKWVATLEKNIDYELANMEMSGGSSVSTTPSNTNSTPASAPVEKMAKKSSVDKSKYNKVNSIDLSGKTIYISSVAPYAAKSRIADNIKIECTLNKQLMDFIQEFALNEGLDVKIKNKPSSKDIILKVEITDAVSRGGAFRGHRKFVVISGNLVQGDKSYGSFKAARMSGGGVFGGYKGSCSVLGRTVKALGKDVSKWLYSPDHGARLGDRYLID